VTDNPYASPMAPGATGEDAAASADKLPTAPRGKRLLNLFIDSVMVQVLSFGANVMLSIQYSGYQIAANGAFTADDQAMLELMALLLGVAVLIGYYFVLEATCQKTLGKLLTGTMVVGADGERPTPGQIFGRSFARFIPLEAFSFVSSKHPVGWHDSLASTRVVLAR